MLLLVAGAHPPFFACAKKGANLPAGRQGKHSRPDSYRAWQTEGSIENCFRIPAYSKGVLRTGRRENRLDFPAFVELRQAGLLLLLSPKVA